MSDVMIKALLDEREGYVRRGLSSRVAMIDDALKSLGYETEVREIASVEPREEKAAVKKAAPRRKA